MALTQTFAVYSSGFFNFGPKEAGCFVSPSCSDVDMWTVLNGSYILSSFVSTYVMLDGEPAFLKDVTSEQKCWCTLEKLLNLRG